MKIIGGIYKGRNIRYPHGAVNLRPTSALVRKAIFDMVGSISIFGVLGVIEGAEVADIYAGTGMLGIEAISRGAGRVTFVESNHRAAMSIKQNLDDLGVPVSRYSIIHSRVDRFLRSSSMFDIAFVDAPYDLVYSVPGAYSVVDHHLGEPAGHSGHAGHSGPARHSGSASSSEKRADKRTPVIGGNLLSQLRASLAVIETRPGDYIIPSGWEVIKQHRYGGTMVTVLHMRTSSTT